MQKVTEYSGRSFHGDYLQFAIQSYRSSKEQHEDWTVNRHIIDCIFYSYACIEATTEFIHWWKKPIEENWLIRYVERKWHNLSVSDKIGLLSFAWKNRSFWEDEDAFQLFQDLKKLRDGLMHLPPFIYIAEKTTNRPTNPVSGQIYPLHEHYIRMPDAQKKTYLISRNAVAQFKNDPSQLDQEDAEQVIEILLRHLLRFDDIFFDNTGEFSFWEDNMALLTIHELLQNELPTHRFENVLNKK